VTSLPVSGEPGPRCFEYHESLAPHLHASKQTSMLTDQAVRLRADRATQCGVEWSGVKVTLARESADGVGTVVEPEDKRLLVGVGGGLQEPPRTSRRGRGRASRSRSRTRRTARTPQVAAPGASPRGLPPSVPRSRSPPLRHGQRRRRRARGRARARRSGDGRPSCE
jgi:hypothetical protein